MSTLTQHDSGDSTRLIVCEKSGVWANRLRRNLPRAGKWIVETRSLNQLLESVQEHPSSFVLLELSRNNVQDAIGCVDELHRQYPHCLLTATLPAVAVGTLELPAGLIWMLREFGAQDVIRAARDISALRRLWSCHCRLHPPHEQTLRERVFQRLPWAEC